MVVALSWRQAPGRISLDDERVAAEHRRAGLGYLAWPVCLYELLVVREGSSSWLVFHARQAFWFGLLTGIAGVLALVWPLVLTSLIANITVTIWVYAFALLIDIMLFVMWLVLAIRCSRQAARGEMFEIPIVAEFTRKLFAKR
ncbi:MAG: hypothetical protein ABI182_06150 [Candidatus Baltobacteraceae bacterium]